MCLGWVTCNQRPDLAARNLAISRMEVVCWCMKMHKMKVEIAGILRIFAVFKRKPRKICALFKLQAFAEAKRRCNAFIINSSIFKPVRSPFDWLDEQQ